LRDGDKATNGDVGAADLRLADDGETGLSESGGAVAVLDAGGAGDADAGTLRDLGGADGEASAPAGRESDG
jgi:hypothetical protein